MSIFDKYCLKKDELLRRRIEVDNFLYEDLVKLSNIYDASVNRLVNIAILEMINSENVTVYTRNDDEMKEAHNFAIRKSSYKELEKMRNKYGLSIYKLVNIAIYNAINDK